MLHKGTHIYICTYIRICICTKKLFSSYILTLKVTKKKSTSFVAFFQLNKTQRKYEWCGITCVWHIHRHRLQLFVTFIFTTFHILLKQIKMKQNNGFFYYANHASFLRACDQLSYAENSQHFVLSHCCMTVNICLKYNYVILCYYKYRCI